MSNDKWGDQKIYKFLQFFINLSYAEMYESSVVPQKKGHSTRHISPLPFSETRGEL